MSESTIITYIVLLCFLILMSAYFSATETAFSSLNKTRLKAIAEKGNKKAILASKLEQRYDNLISTILVGNNIVNIAAASIGTVLFVNFYGDIGPTISTAVMTVLVLIFGEVTPKSIAKDHPENFAMFSAPFLRILMVILTPINFVFSKWKLLIARIFRGKENEKMSQEELLLFVDEVQQDGSIDDSNGDLLRNAIEFTGRKAEDILTHRVDLEAVSVDEPKEEIAEAFLETKFSRLLVYEENIDNIVGVIHQKDFYTGAGISPLPVEKIMRPPLFVPKSEKINELLKLLQINKSHVAVVLDEYGGTLGIVTMEDILEELVGEIWDEHDEVVESFQKLEEDVYRVDCSLDFDEFCAFFGIKAESESVSLSGWISEQLGKIPEEGENFRFEHLDITVSSIDSRRVEYIIVHRLEAESEEKDADDSKKSTVEE